MTSEKEYVVQSFRKHFADDKKKRIVIYGIGPNTKAILDDCVDYEIVALMDAATEGEILWGKKIIGVSELKSYKADMIVIVARYCNVSIIYDRIAEYCMENQIPVYTINGKLLRKQDDVGNGTPVDVDKDKLLRLIGEHEVISFDVFDTLIMRKTLYPIDVFGIVESRAEKKGLPQIDFANLRVKSERKVNAEMIPDIYDIYREMEQESNVDKETLNQYRELELETEKQLIVVRKEMKDIFDNIIKQGKKVYLISDMYWSAEVLEEILSQLGISGYQRILVSCDYRETKGTRLFEIFKEQVKANSYLHIGDNYEIDYLMAERNGIDAYHVLSAYEMMKISTVKDILRLESKMNLAGRCMIGFYIAKAFSNPFGFEERERRAVVTTERDFGYMFLGAVVTEFIFWIGQQMENQDGTVFFTARDGYILKDLYDEYRATEKAENFPDSEYFLTSRMCSMISGLVSEQDILFAAEQPFTGTAEAKVARRFMLRADEIEQKLPEESEKDYILRHSDKILNKSRRFRANYDKYLDSVYHGQSVYWVDFVSSGTCQYYFEKRTGQSVLGKYFYRFMVDAKEKSRLHIDSMYEASYAYEGERWLLRTYIFLESIFTSYEPTLKCFDESGKPIYWEEKRTKEHLNGLKEIHEGIKEYFREYLSLGLKPDGALDVADGLIGCMWKKYSRVEVDFIDSNVLEDEFANRSFDTKVIIQEA